MEHDAFNNSIKHDLTMGNHSVKRCKLSQEILHANIQILLFYFECQNLVFSLFLPSIIL